MSERDRGRRSGPSIEGSAQEPSTTNQGVLGSLVERFGPAGAQRVIQRRLAQRKARNEQESAAQVHSAAEKGISGAGGPLPHLDTIQKSFGKHDVSHVKAHTDGAAAQGATAMGAEAFATGNHVAFAGTPSLHTAAHEAAHVVQQQGGVQLKGGVGEVGDEYERHADEVADRVVAGQSAQGLLDRYAASAERPMPKLGDADAARPHGPGRAPMQAQLSLGAGGAAARGARREIVQRLPLAGVAANLDAGGDWTPTVDGSGRVTKVVATNLKLKAGATNVAPSGTNSPAANPPSWAFYQTNALTNGQGPPNYVRMHLLNGRVGGPGAANNLAPGTASLNAHHSYHCEEPLKEEIEDGNTITNYTVNVAYNGGGAGLSAGAQAAWQDTINGITGQFSVTDKKGVPQPVRNFSAVEDANLDKKANWLGL